MLRRFIAFPCLCPIAGIASAQFYYLLESVVETSSSFVQTSNDSVIPSNAWILNIRVRPFYADTQGVTIVVPFTAAMTKPPNQSYWVWNSAYFPSRADLDTAYSDTMFCYMDVALSTGTPRVYMTLTGPKLPAAPPRFVGNAYDGLQGANPNQDIVLSLDEFTIPASAAESETRLDVRDLDHSVFVFSAVNPGNGTSQFTIPAGTLKPETAYYVEATRTGRTITNSSFSGIYELTVAGHLSTQLTFITRRCVADLTGDGVSDLEDFFSFFNCWDIEAPCADLDGTPGVDLSDFFAFFDAFDTAC